MDVQEIYEEWRSLVEQFKEIPKRKRELRKLLDEHKFFEESRYTKVKSRYFDRELEMVSLYRDGKTLQEIGDLYGLTRERVRQLIKRHDVTGKDGGGALKPKISDHQCKAGDCERLAKRSSGYCHKHHARYEKHGDPLKLLKTRNRVCEVEGCDLKHKANGYCNTHLHRWRRTGDSGSAEILPVGKHKNRGKQKKLSDSDIEEIRSLYVRGKSGKASEFSTTGLGKKYGVSPTHIGLIINNKIYARKDEGTCQEQSDSSN